MKRKHMPSHVQLQERMPRYMRTDDEELRHNDVFAMVKATMAAPALCQDPLLVMPAQLLHQSQALIRNANLPSCPVITATIDQERRDELRVLHRALQRDFPTMRRALAYYESLIRGDGTTQQVPELGFLRHAAAHNQVDFPRALADRQPGPKPHELQVVFHRAR